MDGTGAVITYHELCHEDDIWVGDMDAFTVAGRSILLINTDDGFKAFANACPHQDVPLVHGKLAGCKLTCRAHHWEFDVITGLSVNPSGQRLTQYPVRVIDGTVQVGDVPLPRQNT